MGGWGGSVKLRSPSEAQERGREDGEEVGTGRLKNRYW